MKCKEGRQRTARKAAIPGGGQMPSLHSLSGGGEIMDINTIVTLIGSLGFPIVMCILLFRQSERQNERMDEQTAKTTEAITKLEKAITILTERLSGGNGGIEK